MKTTEQQSFDFQIIHHSDFVYRHETLRKLGTLHIVDPQTRKSDHRNV